MFQSKNHQCFTLFRRRLCITIMFVTILSSNFLRPPVNVKADVAPPPDAPIGNLGPYIFKKTKVKMQSERVQIDISADPLWNYFSKLQVDAHFVFQNMGSSDEYMQAIFPFSDINECGSGGYFYEVDEESFNVSIDGQPVKTSEFTTPSQVREHCSPEKWGKFEIHFPVRKNVNVDINYTMLELDYMRMWSFPKRSFYYLLETGAGWYGTIGKAEVIVNFPYDITKENATLPPGYTIRGNQARWYWENLEPTKYDNIIIQFIEPDKWEKLTNLRANTETNPWDADQWIEISDLYLDMAYYFNPRLGIEHWGFAHQAVHAYRQAMQLRPEAADIRASYAWLLCKMSYQGNGYQLSLSYPSVQRILREIDIILAQDPDNKTAHGILDYIDCRISGIGFCR